MTVKAKKIAHMLVIYIVSNLIPIIALFAGHKSIRYDKIVSNIAFYFFLVGIVCEFFLWSFLVISKILKKHNIRAYTKLWLYPILESSWLSNVAYIKPWFSIPIDISFIFVAFYLGYYNLSLLLNIEFIMYNAIRLYMHKDIQMELARNAKEDSKDYSKIYIEDN